MENISVCSRFVLKKKLGAGSFGEIYSAEDTVTRKLVAIKLENIKLHSPQLEYEARLYKILNDGAGIPKLYYFGSDKHINNNCFNVMAIDLLGKSLEDLLMLNKKPFSLKTVLMLADQMIDSVQYLHQRHFIHRDIKPDNFVMGLSPNNHINFNPRSSNASPNTSPNNSLNGPLNNYIQQNNSNKVFMIDFGLAKRYRDPKTFQHIPFTKGKSLTGTARYASLNAMCGYEQSRRDDLESLGFVLVYLLKGKLPWQGLPARDQKQKMKKITDVKKQTTIPELCSNIPKEFEEYLESVRNLDFNEEPNYSYYKQLFRDLFIREGYIYDYQYDWIIKNNPPQKRKDNNHNRHPNIKENEVDHKLIPEEAKYDIDPQVKFIIKPPDELGRNQNQLRPHFRRFIPQPAKINSGNNNNPNSNSGQLQNQITEQNQNAVQTARAEKVIVPPPRLRPAHPISVPRLPSLTPRINKPQIAPRHYHSRRAVVPVGE